MTVDPPNPPEPKLRFPEFVRRPLHVVRLRDVTAESKFRNGKKLPPTSIMGVSKVEGIVPMEEGLAASDISRYKIVRKDWFAYNPMRLNIGSLARWRGERDILVSPDYVVFRCLDESHQIALSADYLDHFRRSEQWDAFITGGGNGGVRVRIYYDDIAQLQLGLPDIAEQQKIADCLGSLDDLIAAEGRKLKALRQHKKGLMERLFPQEGETQPRLRFPEFRDAADWDATQIGSACDLKAGDFVPATLIAETQRKGLYPCYGGNGLRGYVASHTHDGRHVLVGRQGALCGNVLLCDGRFHATEHALVATPCANVDAGWLFYALDALRLNRFAVGQAQPGLSVGVLDKVAISVPADLDEQQRIAGCLSSLDATTAAHARKLGTLKQHKQGLLQQLLSDPEVK